MSPGAWFLIAAILAGLICTLIGLVRAARALKRVRTHADAMVPDALVARALAAKDAAERLQGSMTLIEALLPRLSTALDESAFALRELRSAFSLRR